MAKSSRRPICTDPRRGCVIAINESLFAPQMHPALIGSAGLPHALINVWPAALAEGRQ